MENVLVDDHVNEGSYYQRERDECYVIFREIIWIFLKNIIYRLLKVALEAISMAKFYLSLQQKVVCVCVYACINVCMGCFLVRHPV